MSPRDIAALGRSRPFLPVPGIDGYGAWRTFTWSNEGEVQHGVALVPEVPPWRQLFAALDDIGATLSDSPPSELDEADAITACCWRYGSYFHVLTGGEFYPPFRRDASLSRIGDAEMRRINIEFTAALGDWLATKQEAPARIARRVGAALTTLPMPWRAKHQPWLHELLKRAANQQAETLQHWFEKNQDDRGAGVPGFDAEPRSALRMEANWVVLGCYRNGPVEDLHAGKFSLGSEVPGFMRLYGHEVDRLSRRVSESIAGHLFGRAVLSPEALRAASTIGSPDYWTLTDETSHVTFLGMPGIGSLEPRLSQLAHRYPGQFSGALAAAQYNIRDDRIVE